MGSHPFNFEIFIILVIFFLVEALFSYGGGKNVGIFSVPNHVEMIKTVSDGHQHFL